jgi:hypothetical protein
MRAMIACLTGATVAMIAMASCGNNKPVEPPHVDVDAEPPDAAPPDLPEAAPPDAAPPPKTIALCSVSGDSAASKQCITWTGCSNGILQTLGGKPIRKCAPKGVQCEDVEAKLIEASQRLTLGARSCKTKFYLGKLVVIGDASYSVCPEDPDDKMLSTLWKQIVPTCRGAL